MEDAFRNPPATLQDAFLASLDRLGISIGALTHAQVSLYRDVVSYAYLSGVGRMVALLPADGDACNAQECALQLKQEALQVLVEVASTRDRNQTTSH